MVKWEDVPDFRKAFGQGPYDMGYIEKKVQAGLRRCPSCDEFGGHWRVKMHIVDIPRTEAPPGSVLIGVILLCLLCWYLVLLWSGE